MDYSKTKVFSINENKIKNMSQPREFIEKDVQKFYEENLQELLGAELIKTEYAIEGGRLDTFAIDQDNRPVIIEYKKDTSDSVLLQALFYKNYIKNNWEKAYMTIKEIKGVEIADEIDFANIRVILVAQKYDKWTIASTSFLDGVELYSFAFFKETFIQEFLNKPKDKRFTRKIIVNNDNKKYPSVSDADYSKDEYVISSSGQKVDTNTHKFNTSSESVKLLYEQILDFASTIAPQTEVVYNKTYWLLKSEKKYLEVFFYKNKIRVQLNLPNDFSDTKLKFKNLQGIDFQGSLKYRVDIENKDDFEEIKKLIKLSLQITNNNYI